MDANVINPFVKATVEVIQTMAFVTARAGKPYVKKDQFATGDVTSIVGLTGEPNGTISISFDQGSILAMVSNMFGAEMEELNDEVADAVGELCNMISGKVRRPEAGAAGRIASAGCIFIVDHAGSSPAIRGTIIPIAIPEIIIFQCGWTTSNGILSCAIYSAVKPLAITWPRMAPISEPAVPRIKANPR